MTFWQENYHFIKDVYDMRHQKMAEWMENVEKAIARIMADKVYTSAEFKRERDNFHGLCKDLEKVEVKKWLAHILEILMAERAKDQRKNEFDQLDALIKKHEELIPWVQKISIQVDLYWKCYAYGDELKPHIEFLEGIMMSSTREIAPSCVENVEELIERQEKALVQLETKRNVVKDLIEKGNSLLQNPEKPKFLDEHVSRIVVGWDDTKLKAQERLKLLQDTKSAWEGYAEGQDIIENEFNKAEEEMKKIKKRFNLESAKEDLAKRQQIFEKTKKSLQAVYDKIKSDYDTMCLTLPDDKKNLVQKELAALTEKMAVLSTFEEKVKKIEDFCNNLSIFDNTNKSLNDWMKKATEEMDKIKNHSHQMVPEDRVAVCMELQEDIAAKVLIIEANIAKEQELLPQGDSVPKDALEHKEELERIHKYVLGLQNKVKQECAAFSEDVKYWAEYRTGIKEFTPWLISAETESKAGLGKPSSLPESLALFEKIEVFDKKCLAHLKILESAETASKKMTTHQEADDQIAELMNRYKCVKKVSDTWLNKVNTLVQEWKLLDSTVNELNEWVAKDKSNEGEHQFSLEKMESTLSELKNIFKEKEKLVDNL
ncbi:golgin subfamily A member 4 isoform X4 [Eurytemora carolleeae]|uniref:golgin subfamily A member 4 isoform X4 n=1 Tax=Eurytemora carolleeae TaxID=1294199 RepID=UPI000C75A3DE|nr:golgin subfamily A member 4 isoform X4 [Eurytemora carolleeae]|eukprot:XP_023321287.1 golgin subfamily A member 4-like isoform X4 [Eurytemora affinis]